MPKCQIDQCQILLTHTARYTAPRMPLYLGKWSIISIYKGTQSILVLVTSTQSCIMLVFLLRRVSISGFCGFVGLQFTPSLMSSIFVGKLISFTNNLFISTYHVHTLLVTSICPPKFFLPYLKHSWLVVSTHLKNMLVKMGIFPNFRR